MCCPGFVETVLGALKSSSPRIFASLNRPRQKPATASRRHALTDRHPRASSALFFAQPRGCNAGRSGRCRALPYVRIAARTAADRIQMGGAFSAAFSDVLRRVVPFGKLYPETFKLQPAHALRPPESMHARIGAASRRSKRGVFRKYAARLQRSAWIQAVVASSAIWRANSWEDLIRGTTVKNRAPRNRIKPTFCSASRGNSFELILKNFDVRRARFLSHLDAINSGTFRPKIAAEFDNRRAPVAGVKNADLGSNL